MCPPPGQNRVKGPKYFTGTGTKTGAGNGWETRLGERLRPNESVNMYFYKTEGEMIMLHISQSTNVKDSP